MRSRLVAPGLGLLLILTACAAATDSPEHGPWPRFALDDRRPALGAHPFPSDVRQPAGEPVRLPELPNPLDLPTVDALVGMIEETRTGAPLLAGMQIPFAAPPDRSGWPVEPVATTAPTSPLQLVELAVDDTPSGRRVPIRWKYFAAGGPYHAPDTLRVMPDWGFGLEPDATYALVFRHGAGVARSPAMTELLAGRTPEGVLGARAADAMEPALDALADAGLAPEDLAYVQVLTTDDPAAALRRPFEAVMGAHAPARIRDLQRTRTEPAFCLLEGEIRLPQFQEGRPPYYPAGGAWTMDVDGAPVLQGHEWVPFSVVLPTGTMPAAGWPLLVYVHGTAGLSTQVIDRGPTPPDSNRTTPNRGPGWVLARRGIASAGAALPVNPERVPEALGWGIYNFANPRALRDNFRQGAVEQGIFLRTLLSRRLDPSLCPDADASAAPDGRIGFRAERVANMGQSLGAIEVGLWTPVEPLVQATIPSGAGGLYTLMLDTTTIIPGELILRLLTSVNAGARIDALHPVALFVEMAFEPVDPVALASRVVRRPLPEIGPKHVYLPTGYLDGFFHPGSIQSLAGPLGVELTGDRIHESLWDLAGRTGRTAGPYPVSENVRAADGTHRTAVAVQWAEDGILDGHHVSYQLEGPKHQYGCFLRTFFDGRPLIPAPVTSAAPCR